MSSPIVVIVTGAALGIGAAITDKLLQSPNTHLVLVDLSEEALKQRQGTVGADRIQYIIGDVGKTGTNVKAVEKAISTWGKLDALVLNAGIMGPVHRICGAKAEEWTNIFNVNLISQVAMLSEAIPHLREVKGRVIITSSDAGIRPKFKSWGAYGATKAALNYLIATLTLEEPSITTIGIYPGVVDTPLVQRIFSGEYSAGMSEEELEFYMNTVKPRLVKPEQPGAVIAGLAVEAKEELGGWIGFWDDGKLSEYR